MSDIVQKIYDDIQNLGAICGIHMGMDVWKEIEAYDKIGIQNDEKLVVSYTEKSVFERTKIIGSFCNMDVIIVDYFPPNTYFFVPRKISLLPSVWSMACKVPLLATVAPVKYRLAPLASMVPLLVTFPRIWKDVFVGVPFWNARTTPSTVLTNVLSR